MQKTFGDIHYYKLPNGLKVIINPDNASPKVSAQLWYAVGSKDEQAGEKGLAHLLEHMIFKGTKRLSESDINLISAKLSGYTNAFTSYDYTGYLFDFPKQHWQAALDLFSDCMFSCTFDEDMLQSELKAVIQELKLYKDDYSSSLIEAMVAQMFPDHPYHHPIIGYKQDLWSITRQGLLDFYKKHYRPDNATLVIVGDVDVAQAKKTIEQYFGSLHAEPTPVKRAMTSAQGMHATAVTLYRDVQRPTLLYAWRVPGLKEKKDVATSALAYLVGESKSSLLYRRLVDELDIATDTRMFFDDMFDYGVLFLQIDPVGEQNIDQIEKELSSVISLLRNNEYAQADLLGAIKQSRTESLLQGEDFQDRAYTIGKAFLATGDSDYLNEAMTLDVAQIEQDVAAIIKDYVRVAQMHRGALFPLPATEKEHWLALQQESDRTDSVILSRKVRESEVEDGKYVHQIKQAEPGRFSMPDYKRLVLQNGLPVLFYKNTHGQKVEIQLDFDTQYYHDPEQLQGLTTFMFALLQEGTEQYSGIELAKVLAAHGMQLDVRAGFIGLTLLKDDLPFGLYLIDQLCQHALFEERAIEKVRTQLLADIDTYWDMPSQFVQQMAREHIYQQHPYGKRYFGTKETVARIKREDLVAWYQEQLSPLHARLAIVGNLDDTIFDLVQEKLGSWQGNEIKKTIFPALIMPERKEIIHPMARDQVVLAFAGLSVNRTNPLYDPLLLFDQIFTGGAQHSMSSHLFQLREQTGLFYTIGGSLVHAADKEPGMLYIKTLVSQDRLQEAQEAIQQCMYQASRSITQEDVVIAKDALFYQLLDQFATQKGVGQTMLFVERMQLPKDYYEQRLAMVRNLGVAQVVDAAEQILQPTRISVFKIGRL